MSRRTEATRRRLLALTREIIAEQGAGVSLNEVAERAGITRMTLYRHFGPRNQLLLEVLLDELRDLAEQCRVRLGDTSVPIAERAFATSVFMATSLRGSLVATEVIAGSTLADFGRLDPSGETHKLVDGVLRPFFEEARSDGVLRGDIDSAVTWSVRQIVAMLYQLPWEGTGSDTLSDELAQHFVPSLLVVTPEHLAALNGDVAVRHGSWSEPVH